jgi:hypothetical protein
LLNFSELVSRHHEASEVRGAEQRRPGGGSGVVLVVGNDARREDRDGQNVRRETRRRHQEQVGGIIEQILVNFPICLAHRHLSNIDC